MGHFKLEEQRKDEYLRVFHHELGHWFIAKQVGFVPQYIEVTSRMHAKWVSGGHCSTVLYSKCKENNIANYLINRQLVLLAGAVFEAVYANAGLEDAIVNLHCRTAKEDNNKFIELAMISLNLKLGEIDESIDELCQRVNTHGTDKLYQEILRHREYLARVIYICRDVKIKDFIMQAEALFIRYVEECGWEGKVILPGEELDGIYSETIKDYLLPKKIEIFSQGVLQP